MYEQIDDSVLVYMWSKKLQIYMHTRCVSVSVCTSYVYVRYVPVVQLMCMNELYTYRICVHHSVYMSASVVYVLYLHISCLHKCMCTSCISVSVHLLCKYLYSKHTTCILVYMCTSFVCICAPVLSVYLCASGVCVRMCVPVQCERMYVLIVCISCVRVYIYTSCIHVWGQLCM